jgi:predicted type IV restriction endonuclease
MSIQSLTKAIEQAQKDLDWLQEKGILELLTEEQTRLLIIDPILRALGWATPNLYREWNLPDGKRVDYALFLGDRLRTIDSSTTPLIIVEAKRYWRGRYKDEPGYFIWDDETTQLRDYADALDDDLYLAVFTNGHTWLLFDIEEGKGMAEHPTEALSITDLDPQDAAQILHRYMGNP